MSGVVADIHAIVRYLSRDSRMSPGNTLLLNGEADPPGNYLRWILVSEDAGMSPVLTRPLRSVGIAPSERIALEFR